MCIPNAPTHNVKCANCGRPANYVAFYTTVNFFWRIRSLDAHGTHNAKTGFPLCSWWWLPCRQKAVGEALAKRYANP